MGLVYLALLCCVRGALSLLGALTSMRRSLCAAVNVKRCPCAEVLCAWSTCLTCTSDTPCAVPQVRMRLAKLIRPAASVNSPSGLVLGYLPNAATALEIFIAVRCGMVLCIGRWLESSWVLRAALARCTIQELMSSGAVVVTASRICWANAKLRRCNACAATA